MAVGWQLALRRIGMTGSSTGSTGNVVAAEGSSGSAPGASKGSSAKFKPSGDPAADFRAILRLRDVATRTAALRELLSAMTTDEVIRFMASIKQYGEDQEQQDQMGGILALMASVEIVVDHVSGHDPGTVLAALTKEDAKSDFYLSVLRNWAARDPDAAKAYFEQHTLLENTESAKAAAEGMVREMVKSDAEGTFRWLRGLKADFTDEVAHGALQTLSHYDSVKAGKLLAANADLAKAPEFVSAMTAGWARTEPEKAFNWARELPANLSGNGLETSCRAWAEKDFPAAMNAISALQGEQKASALQGLASGAGEKNFPAVVPLVEALPDSSSKASAVGSIMSSWMDQSPEAASAWLVKQPVGAARDQGSLVLALKLIQTEPESAMEWAATVQSPEKRSEGTNGLVEAWLNKDPKAARAWVQQSTRLSETDRARLLEKTGR